MSNNKLDMDDVQRQIDSFLNRGTQEDPSSIPNFAPVPQQDEAVEDEHRGENHHFIGIHYTYKDSSENPDVKEIESFTMNMENISTDPKDVITHLRAVIDHLENIESFEEAKG